MYFVVILFSLMFFYLLANVSLLFYLQCVRYLQHDHFPAGWARNRDMFSKFKNIDQAPTRCGKSG